MKNEIKASKTQSHTGFRNGNLFCFNCGGSQVMPLPMPFTMAADFMKSFDKLHKACKKTWVEPVNEEAESKREVENCYWWLRNGEHGVSSKTMFKHLSSGVYDLAISHESHPHDPDDFRRCYLLLQAIPQFKNRLENMKRVSSVWERLVNNWEKLTVMLEEQIVTKKANGMYEFMQSLIQQKK